MTGACLLLALAAELPVAGNHTCPTAPAVAQALAEIAPGIDGGTGETVHIERDAGGAAVVRFRSAGGQLRFERPLPVALSCADRARAAAVMIAAHAGTAAPEPVPPARIPPAPVQAPAVARRLPAVEETGPGAFPPTELEFAALGALSGGGPVPGGRVGVARGVRQQDRLRLSLGYTWTARAPLAAGQATWSRAFLALGYGRRFAPAGNGTTFVEPGAELMASALRIGSEGFAVGETHTVFHPGVAAGVRLGQRFGRSVLLWAGLGATFWPRPQRVFLRDVPETARIPRLESWALLGVGFSPR